MTSVLPVLALTTALTLAGSAAFAQDTENTGQETMNFETSGGPLMVTPLGHGSLRLEFGGKVIHVDPYSEVADYSAQPKADWVWVTHDHPDHYDPAALEAVQTENTQYLMDATSAEKFGSGDAVTVMQNGDETTADGITVRAVPAYNLVQGPEPGAKFHPKGQYNGYLATFGDFTVYIAGDTECIPEMGSFGAVDLAFVPINLPYTMPPEEAVGCIKVVSPTVVVPYHQGEADPQIVADALRGSDVEVRVLALP